MTDATLPPDPAVPTAQVHRRRHLSAIWLVPLVALLAAGFLGYRSLATRGPMISILFRNADGLTAGQTAVRYRAVQIGTVEGITLNPDFAGVRVDVRMRRQIASRLTDRGRFWVVRARLTPAAISGLDTLVSGTYIEFDPGSPGGAAADTFTGLETPPGVRSDEPGRIFTLRSERVGSVGPGSPVFFRDVAVGEVLSADPPGFDGDILLHAFVRAPFDGYVRDSSRFWNASGVSVRLGAQGVRLELESLQAVLAGGVAFSTPDREHDAPPAAAGHEFVLHQDLEAARSATSRERINFRAYFDSSVRGLANGAPVETQGVRIGSVTRTRLEYDAASEGFRAAVDFAVEPDRISYPSGRPMEEVRAAAERFVARGMRAGLGSASLITGQQVVTLDFAPDAPAATVRMEDDVIVLPTLPGGDIMRTVSELAARVGRFPIEQIGANLNGTLAAARGLVGGPELTGAIRSLNATLGTVQALVRNTDASLAPALRRLPAITAELEHAVTRASNAVGSIERGYGGDSDLHRQLERFMQQAGDTARSIRLLADFLDRHPEALVRGRTGAATER